MKRLLYFFLFITACMPAMAQNTWDSGIINPLKKDGRIYIVIVVVAIILLGMFWYMWRLDKKITRIEQQTRK